MPVVIPSILFRTAQRFLPASTFYVPTQHKTVYLTFDDGPQEKTTRFVVNTLASFQQTKATFFCLGQEADNHHDILQEIKQQGHSIGNHSYEHLDAWKTALPEFLKDVQKGNSTLNSTLFRPPYGHLTWSAYKLLSAHYRIIMWDVLSYDFDRNRNWKECLQICKQNIRPGSIIVMHDSHKAWHNVESLLPALLNHLFENGYTCKTL